MTMSLTSQVAEYAVATQARDLPCEIRELAKKVVFDEMACARFGRRSAAGSLAARFAQSMSSSQDASIFGTPFRASAPYAAMANGAAGHGEEVDGAHIVGGHPGATIVHAVVATGERQRSSGADVLNAVVLGYDIGTRLIEACGGTFAFQDRTAHHGDFLHGIGASVAAGRLLGLDAARLCHTMALSTFQVNGLAALFQEKRHISKSFCNGQYAFGGVSAALMAAVGLEGSEDILGSSSGVLKAWGESDHGGAIVEGLGSRYAIEGANFKFINAGYPIHSALEAALSLMEESSIDSESIETVRVGMATNAMKIVDNRHMHNICLQDMMAATITRRGFGLSEALFPAILSEPAYKRMRSRITLVADAGLDRELPNGRAAVVQIGLASGETVSKRVDCPRGHSRRGVVTWDELLEKWRNDLPGCDVSRAVVVAQELEDVDDISSLVQCFA